MANSDPFYNRKPVPDEFIEHVGITGLTKQEEHLNRERKYSRDGGDLRKFSNPKNKATGQLDPHYARRPVPDSMIAGVGVTGLSQEEEFMNRERKMSVNGVDLRKFSTSRKSGMEPQDDPYYGRKPVDSALINGIGDTGMSQAEEYEVRERKQSIFQESTDPFQQLSGTGHRQSISAAAGPVAAEARRRSSAVGPDATTAMHNHQAGGHSGYTGGNLNPITSHVEDHPSTTTTTTTHASNGQHGLVHDVVTDPDSVAPHEVR